LSLRERGGIPASDDFFGSPFGSGRSESEPIVGRASIRASSLPVAPPQTSGESEPYPLAPSAEMPPVHVGGGRPPTIIPPSYPPSAPPPETMSEPEERPSILPEVTSPPSRMDRAVSSAPDPDELDEMFDAISRPPSMPAPGFTPAELPDVHAPRPPFVGEGIRSPVPPDVLASVDGVEFFGIVGLQDLTDEAAQLLAQSAKIVSLAPGEYLGPFGVAIVTAGALQLAPENVNAVFATVKKGEVLFFEGTLECHLVPRVMASQPGTRVAVFSKEALDAATMESPWVADELAEIADGYQAHAGAVMGKLGSSLDEMFRPMVLDKCTVKAKSSGDTIATAGGSPWMECTS
jgi:hypothetical protein